MQIIDSFFKYAYLPAGFSTQASSVSLTKAVAGAVTGSVSSLWSTLLLQKKEPKQRTQNPESPATLPNISYWDLIQEQFQHLASVKYIQHHTEQQQPSLEWIEILITDPADFIKVITELYGSPQYHSLSYFTKNHEELKQIALLFQSIRFQSPLIASYQNYRNPQPKAALS